MKYREYICYDQDGKQYAENGCCGLISALYELECDEISADCVAEGYPSHGSNYDLRASGLWDDYYQSWYDEAMSYHTR